MPSVLIPVVRFREPYDAHVHAAENPTARRVLDTWHDHVGCRQDIDADHEDFWEGAYRLDAAITSGADTVWVYADQRQPLAHLSGDRDTTAPVSALLADPDVLVYGSIARFGSSAELSVRYKLDVIDWPVSRALRPHLRRRVAPCGFMDDESDPRDISNIIASFVADGAETVFVKTSQKGMHAAVPVTGNREADRRALFDAFDWEPVRLGDQPGAFIVSAFTAMRYEYRMYLVDGVPVTGAGNVEAHTPLDAIAGRPFHPGMEWIRGRSPVTVEPAIVERYVDFATRVGADLIVEGRLPRVLNIDVAMTVDDEPVVVEVHSGLINTGLFATDPHRFLRRVVESSRVRQVAA